MEQKAIMVLPVVDQEGKVQGIVHLHDLLGRGEFKFTA
jgi:arabinose-5-phosphate isomerase